MTKLIHIALVNDEAIQVDTMTSLIYQAAENMDQTVQVTSFSIGEALSPEYITGNGI